MLILIQVNTTLKEHSCYVNNQNFSKSSIIKHFWYSGHSFNFQNAQIIFNANRPSELNFLENLTISFIYEIIVNKKICFNHALGSLEKLFNFTI